MDLPVAAMPDGTQIQSAESCGVSAWTKTAKVTVELPDGSSKRYFLKVGMPYVYVGRLITNAACYRTGRASSV